MSERESSFMRILTVVLGGFLLALLLGGFAFYRTTLVQQGIQDEKILNTINTVNALGSKVETMRVEWREDHKEIKANIDAIRTTQIEENTKLRFK